MAGRLRRVRTVLPGGGGTLICVDPALAAYPNLTLLLHAYVERLLTDPSGHAITGIGTVVDGGQKRVFSAGLVVVACGALSSALLFLRSANDAHPAGLANASGQVGRNYMRHNNAVLMAVSMVPNPTRFQKTLGLNDFYLRSDDWEYPLGHIQMVGKSDGTPVHGEALPPFLRWLPEQPFDWLAEHSIDFWLTSEDLPRPEDRIFYKDGRVHLDLTQTNVEGNRRLWEKLRQLCDRLEIHPHLFPRDLYLGEARLR